MNDAKTAEERAIWCAAFAAQSHYDQKGSANYCADVADNAVRMYRDLSDDRALQPLARRPPDAPRKSADALDQSYCEAALRFIAVVTESSSRRPDSDTIKLVSKIVELVLR